MSNHHAETHRTPDEVRDILLDRIHDAAAALKPGSYRDATMLHALADAYSTVMGASGQDD